MDSSSELQVSVNKNASVNKKSKLSRNADHNACLFLMPGWLTGLLLQWLFTCTYIVPR